MIEKIEVFKAVCDKCHLPFEVDGLQLHFDSVIEAKQELKDNEWYVSEKHNKVYCSECEQG